MGLKSLEKTAKKHKRGLWSPEEDQRLRDYILQHGISCWSSVPINAGLQRNGKSCRLRWINYLRPGLKRGMFNIQEEETILTLHSTLGNKWSQIAKHLPGRTDNEIKNYWHSYLKKRAAKNGEVEANTEPKYDNLSRTLANDLSINQTIEVPLVDLESTGSADPMSRIEHGLQEFPRQGHENVLPELVFDDWLTVETIEQNGPMYQPAASSKDSIDYTSEKHEDLAHGFPYYEGSSSYKFSHEIEDGLQKGMLDIPFSFQDQSVIGSHFMNLAPGNAVYSGFG